MIHLNHSLDDLNFFRFIRWINGFVARYLNFDCSNEWKSKVSIDKIPFAGLFRQTKRCAGIFIQLWLSLWNWHARMPSSTQHTFEVELCRLSALWTKFTRNKWIIFHFQNKRNLIRIIVPQATWMTRTISLPRSFAQNSQSSAIVSRCVSTCGSGFCSGCEEMPKC